LPCEHELSTSKKYGPPRDKMVFSKAAFMILIKFQKFVETISPNKTAKMVSSGN
jgi:hypothetical protein